MRRKFFLSVVPQPTHVRLNGGNLRWSGSPRDLHVRHAKTHYAQGYVLNVGRDGVHVISSTSAGVFYAWQTLMQITHFSTDLKSAYTPYVHIEDHPQYRWRGIHLDTSRHHFSSQVIEKYLDVAARYKLNVFHWHLTDDQAWRLPFPAQRYPTMTYSAPDIADIVNYAAQRHIMVVPEIDVPGHSTAILKSYPQFRCGDTFCPTRSSLHFLESVVDQLVKTFPSRYVHLGGDEVANKKAAQFFTPALTKYVQARGRIPIVWDDAAGAGSIDAVVMSWRGERPGITAVRAGRDVVFTTDGPLYFDAYQGDRGQEPRATPHLSTLEQVYDYDVKSSRHVLGIQANLWTTDIPNEDELFYMLLPREIAFAESAWTQPELKDWDSFLERLPAQLDWLAAHGYNFRIPSPVFQINAAKVIGFFSVPGSVQSAIAKTQDAQVVVSLSAPVHGEIRYAIDGAESNYQRPFTMSTNGRHIVRAYVVYDGRRSSTSTCLIERGAPIGGAKGFASLVSP